jgi:hypothetical protein
MPPSLPSLVLSSALALTVPSLAAGWACSEAWDDFCPPGGAPSGVTTCVPYAAPLPAGTDYAALRAAFINSAFNVTDGVLPSTPNTPDYVEAPSGAHGVGCWCSTVGGCDASSCTWTNNLTRLTFTVAVAVPQALGGGDLVVNSTVFWTLNTSGVAPINYPPVGPPSFPEVPMPPQRRSDVLMLMHEGHDDDCESCFDDYDGVVDHVNQAGFDVARFNMPGWGCAPLTIPGQAYTCEDGHAPLAPFLNASVPVLRLFLEPLFRAVSYFTEVVGYKKIVLAGLSGGGWTATLGGALDPRIALSVPIAGSLPMDFHHTSWDAEQFLGPWWQVANYTNLYAAAAWEGGRAQVQVLHEQDPCCFHACGRHDRIRAYNAFVRAQLPRGPGGGGAFGTVATVGNVHEVNVRDRTVLLTLLERVRTAGAVAQADIDALPFNTLREW